MIRKSHIIVLALVAAAVAAPIAQAGNPKPVDPLAVSILGSQGFSPSQIAVMTGSVAPWLTPAERQYVVRISGMTPAQIAAAFGRNGGRVGDLSSVTGAKADPLAVSYLSSFGLSPGEIADWTVGICSHETRPASCFAAFDRTPTQVQTTTSGSFAWGDAGIGAAATLGVVLLTMGLGFMLITRGRRQPGQPKHV